MNKRQIPAQVELGEGSQNATEDQKGKEGDQGHRKKLISQNISKSFKLLKIGEDTVKDEKGAAPKKETHRAQEEESQLPALYVFRNPSVFERQKTRF
jgi:hypothetical protein